MSFHRTYVQMNVCCWHKLSFLPRLPPLNSDMPHTFYCRSSMAICACTNSTSLRTARMQPRCRRSRHAPCCGICLGGFPPSCRARRYILGFPSPSRSTTHMEYTMYTQTLPLFNAQKQFPTLHVSSCTNRFLKIYRWCIGCIVPT